MSVRSLAAAAAIAAAMAGGVALAAPALLGAAPASAEAPADTFTRDAAEVGISHPDENWLVATGLMVCSNLDYGHSGRVAINYINDKTNLSYDSATTFARLAVIDLCPEHMDALYDMNH